MLLVCYLFVQFALEDFLALGQLTAVALQLHNLPVDVIILSEELIGLLFLSAGHRVHLVHLLLDPLVTVLKLSRLLSDLICLCFDLRYHVLDRLLL